MGGKWVGAWTRVLRVGWCYVCVSCKSRLYVYMAGLGICIFCLADTCASKVHPVFNPVAPCGYWLPTVICLCQISQIQACLCVVVGPGFVSTSPAFMRNIASHPAGQHGGLAPKQ